MSRSLAVAALLSLCLPWLSRGADGAVPGQTWQCVSNTSSPTDPVYIRLAKLADEIGNASDGKIRVVCHPSGALPIEAGSVAQAVSDNVLQFAVADSLTYNSIVSAAGVLSLPGLFNSEGALTKGVAAVTPMLDADFRQRGMVMLGVANYPLQVLWSTQKLSSLDDLKGMKLRVTTPEQAEFAVRFGATPITMGIANVATALQRGIMQSVLTASSGGGRILHEILHYNLRTGPNYVSVILIVNKQRFDALPNPLRGKIVELSRRAADDMTTVLQGTEVQLTEQFKKEGMTVTPGTSVEAELISDRMRSYWPKWAAQHGPDAQKALSKVEQAINQ